jgi:5'(3')-deoxyribonucleotidase
MSNREIVLGVDLDEVVFRYCDGLRQRIEAAGSTVPEGDPQFYSMTKSGWFDTDEDFFSFHGKCVDEGLYSQLELIPGARETLWELSDAGYKINIITSRFVLPGQHAKVCTQTVQALDTNDIPYSNISFLDDKVLMRADAFIDDSPKNIEGLLDHGQYVLRMKMRYNVDCGGEPVENWTQIRQVLKNRFNC